MGFFDKFEKGVEGAMNSVFNKLGARDLKPVDLVVALKQETDAKAVAVGDNRKVAPNSFRIQLSSSDFDRIESWGSQEFANELVTAVAEHANAEGYSFIGDVSVTFDEQVENQVGEYQIESESARTDGNEVDKVLEVASVNPTIVASRPYVVINEKTHYLTKSVTIVGRGSECDIILEDTSASRKHFELRVTSGGTVISDLGSTNGIFVEGNKTAAATLTDRNTITVGRTKIVYHSPASGSATPTSATSVKSPVDQSVQQVVPESPENVKPAVKSPAQAPDPFQELNLSEPVRTNNIQEGETAP
jgi:pSer/pThr/pTyr-binding forkhead associated (FHA) protein